jgi:HEPN domain-containing protein
MTPDEVTRAWVERWVRLAEGDLELARLALAHPQFDVYELVGFHAQQAVEKLMKAFLARHGVPFEDRHDLEYLRRILCEVDETLALRIDSLSTLNRYAVGTRYPGRYGIVPREQAESAVRIAEAVRAEIRPLLF